MTPLEPFSVSATRAEVDAFRAATGLPPGEAVPLTFPMRWLAADDVREALLALADDAGLVPVHEAQSFDYASPLVVATDYVMRLEARRDASPDRLVVTGTIEDAVGGVAARLETSLRLISIRAAAA